MEPGSENNPGSTSRFNVSKVPPDNNKFSNSSIANQQPAASSNNNFQSSTASTSNNDNNNIHASPNLSNTVPSSRKKTEKQKLIHQHSLDDSLHGSTIGEMALYDHDFDARPQINTVIQKALRQRYNPMGDQSDVKNHEDAEGST